MIITLLLIVVMGFSALAAVVAVIANYRNERIQAGARRSHSLEDSNQGQSPFEEDEREAEIRQMLQARRRRQISRGETPVDVDAEVERLSQQDW